VHFALETPFALISLFYIFVNVREPVEQPSLSPQNRSPRLARKQVEESFRSAGQAIKVEKVAAGSAPTSQQGVETQSAMVSV
jgi:hypothetical protein